MKHKLSRLLSLGLCLFLMTPTLVFASPVKHQVLEPNMNHKSVIQEAEKNMDRKSMNQEVEQLPEMAIFELDDSQEDSVESAPIVTALETEQSTFLDYFPDPNFAQGVAQHLSRNKEDQVTIDELSTLKTIFLQRKNISSIEGIQYLNNLVSFNVSVNQIQNIPTDIGKLIKLKEFIIFTNQIESIPAEIVNLKNLENFNIGGNLISALPLELFTLTKLRSLAINANFITELPPDIGNLINLTHLHSDRNQINNIPEEFCNLSSLKYLYLQANYITSLPENIGNMQNLNHLWVEANKLSDLPDSIWNISQLTSLSLGSNGYPVHQGHVYFGGNELTAISPKIGQLTNLTDLRIQENQLTEIPSEIGALQNLTLLLLDSNQLTSLPETLTNLTKLKTLHVYYNKITDEIPSGLFDIENFYFYYQNGELPPLYTSDVNTLTHTKLLSPLLLQTLSLNNNEFIGNWEIKKPNGSTITLKGGDGSEITPTLFTDIGTYRIKFHWHGVDPYSQHNGSRAANLSSNIMVEVGEPQQTHNVTIITSYLDNALPEESHTYFVPHGASFLETFDMLEGYDLYNTMLLTMPEFIVDTDAKSVFLDSVDRDYTIKLEFDKTEYRVKLTTTYLDNSLPDTSKSEWIRHDEGYRQTYQIAENYQIANSNLLPADVIVDEINNTVTINNVTKNYNIVLEFEKKQFNVTISIVYDDGSRDDQVSIYAVPIGDSFETAFTIDQGYAIKNVNFNATGVSINRSRQTVSVARVTSPVNITITVW